MKKGVETPQDIRLMLVPPAISAQTITKSKVHLFSDEEMVDPKEKRPMDTETKTEGQPSSSQRVSWYPYQTYGLALCRRDIAAADCKACVNEASNEIHRRCPYDKGAIIWYDNCLLKYSNKDFLGRIDNENWFSLLNVKNVSEPTIVNQKTRELLSQLAKGASFTVKKYGVGELNLGLGESTKLYGLAQCTWDLSTTECFQCLDDAMGQLPSCCDGKQGGRVVGGSCNIRYEIYPFVSA
ncbi:hypothetical protein ACB098_07G042900 [Castanea mollissima]